MTAYEIWKFLHVLGVILLLGNITVTAVWKVFADRSKNPVIIGFGQRLVTGTDFGITIPGIVLTMVGGFGAALHLQMDLLQPGWLLYSEILFVIAGIIWLGILVPLQIRQARSARTFEHGGDVPETYRRDARRWIFWGLWGTVPLVAALWLMVAKPY